MATFFGEILEASSRAFLDDEDDDIDENDSTSYDKSRKFDVSWQGEEKKQSSTFLVFYGPLAKAFAERHLLGSSTVVAYICKSTVDGSLNVSRSSAIIYQLEKNVMACVCQTDVDDTDAVAFTECLFPWLRGSSSGVLILSSASINLYRSPFSPSQLPESILRSLETNSPPPASLAITCPPLEPPNIVAGVPAGVLAWCQREGLKARLVMCYTECSLLDSRSLASFKQLLTCEPLCNLPQSPQAPTKCGPTPAPEMSGNMYI